MSWLSAVALFAVLAAPQAALAQTWGTPAPEPQNPAGLQAGGLAPPGEGTSEPYTYQSAPEQELAEADKKDSGRGLEFFWVNGEVGFEHLGLRTFSDNDLVASRVVPTRQSGLMVGGGLGLRLVFLTIGPRFRFTSFDEYDHWTLDAELGLHIPIGRIEPYFVFAGGYATVVGLTPSQSLESDDINISGWNLRAGGGLDFYLSRMFTVGAVVTGEILFLTRPALGSSALANAEPDGADVQDVYGADGSSVGAATTLSGVIGLHF